VNPEIMAVIARNKLRFFIGTAFLGVFMSIFNFLTFAKVWSGTFEYYGIPLTVIYAAIPLAFIIGCWYFGYWYEMNKLWEYEVVHQTKNLNPQFNELMDDVKEIKKHLGIQDGEKKY
jgi:hypothetical protein